MLKAILQSRFMRHPVLCWYAICMLALACAGPAIYLLGAPNVAWIVANVGSLLVALSFLAYGPKPIARKP